MKRLLTLKPWQIFSLLLGPPTFLFIGLGTLLPVQDRMKAFAMGFLAALLLEAILYVIWLYTLGTSLYNKLPATSPSKVQNFKFVLFLPIWVAIFSLIVAWSSAHSPRPEDDIGFAPGIFIVMAFFFLWPPATLVCLLLSVKFVAKTLKMIEVQKNDKYPSYIGNVLLLLAYPIGVWILQPKLNRIFRSTPNMNSTE